MAEMVRAVVGMALVVGAGGYCVSKAEEVSARQEKAARQEEETRRARLRAIRTIQCRWRFKRRRTSYDAILAFDSLEEFLEKGEVELLLRAESLLEVAAEGRYRIVAVVGLFDKGKTWLVNKLFGVSLPSGKLCTTKGLSFLWIKERRILVVDSAGVQSTVSYRSQAVDAIHDAQTTESMMFEMVSRISHQMVFVVNDLTWFEQKYVAMLHQKYVQNNHKKELIVVHNLRSTSDQVEARQLFKRQVTQCYDGEPSHIGELIFTAVAGEEGAPPVHHVGLCYETSSAGKVVNAKNREWLLASLEHGNKLGTKTVLTKLLAAELSRLLPKFVNLVAKEPETSMAPLDQLCVKFVFTESTDQPSLPDGTRGSYTRLGSLRIQPENVCLTTKTRGVISALGEIIAHDMSFNPLVNVYDVATGSDLKRVIKIECPGVSRESIKWEERANGVKISIDKKPQIAEQSVQPVEPIRQHHGLWEREFVVDGSEGCFRFDEADMSLNNGVLTVLLTKSSNPRMGHLGQPQAQAQSDASSLITSAPSEPSHGGRTAPDHYVD